MPSYQTPSFFGNLIVCLFLIAGSIEISTTEGNLNPKDSGTYYVLAQSGLKLRSGANLQSSKLSTIPYGAKVKILSAAKQRDMLVDNYPGGMAKVEYNGQVGYAFDGYLCRMPIRKAEFRDVFKYMNWAREQGASVLYEKCERDYDGYLQEEEVIMPYINDWAEAFLLAKNLFNLPFDYPAPNNKKEETINNPKKPEMIWEDSLTITRDEEGNITRIIRYYRGEGGGTTVMIEPDGGQNSLRISRTQIAD